MKFISNIFFKLYYFVLFKFYSFIAPWCRFIKFFHSSFPVLNILFDFHFFFYHPIFFIYFIDFVYLNLFNLFYILFKFILLRLILFALNFSQLVLYYHIFVHFII